jgi:hypothetical protein
MFTRIACPIWGHVGVTAASLPRVLLCSKCEHGALIRSGTLARSPIITQEEEAAKRAAGNATLRPPEHHMIHLGKHDICVFEHIPWRQNAYGWLCAERGLRP